MYQTPTLPPQTPIPTPPTDHPQSPQNNPNSVSLYYGGAYLSLRVYTPQEQSFLQHMLPVEEVDHRYVCTDFYVCMIK